MHQAMGPYNSVTSDNILLATFLFMFFMTMAIIYISMLLALYSGIGFG